MRLVVGFVKRTLVGGLLFLVPLAVIAIILERFVAVLRPPTEAIAAEVVGPGVLGPIGLLLLLFLVFLVVCFLAGLLASTFIGRKAVDTLEATVLTRIPGYTMVKDIASNAANNLAKIEASGRTRVVWFRTGEGWKIGFLTDQVDDNMFAVFLPDAPTPSSGELLFASEDQFIDADMNVSDAVQRLALLGGRRRPKAIPDDSIAQQ